MSDEVSRDDNNRPQPDGKPEEKKTGFWKRMFTGVEADEASSPPPRAQRRKRPGAG